MSEMKYAISSYQASLFSVTCFPYILARSEFEKAKNKTILLDKIEKQFNSFLLRIGRSVLNKKLIGPELFDAIELHLTDPRMFYNSLEWKINEKMIDLVRGPISSFHAHMEIDPLLRKYAFNPSDNSLKTRKAIRSQLETAYKIMHAHPNMIVTENPVFVFHGGVARSDDDREMALGRTRKSIDEIVTMNNQLWIEYGRDRKLIPTIENSASDKLFLCQTIDEWKQAIQGFEEEIKLTLDYGHIQTMGDEKDKLFKELREGTIGQHIVNLHLHYSPKVSHETLHAHAALSMIPEDKVEEFQNDIKEIISLTAIREQGYITLEVPSKDPFDYMPTLGHIIKRFSPIDKIIKATGIFDWSPYRGTIEDQLASLEIAKGIMGDMFSSPQTE